ncbi:MAG: transporter substrate-binding domain-containing protein [Sneathiella sp.]
MTTFNRLFSIVLSFFIFTCVAQAETPLRIMADWSFPPYSYKGDDGEASGLHVEITKGALDHAGIEFEIILMPWKRLIQITDAGELDISLPWRYKPERFEKYNMIGPFSDEGSGTYFWARKDSSLTWHNLEDLKDQKIAAISGFAYPKAFEDANYLNKTLLTGDTEMLAKLVYLQRYDLILSDETAFSAAVERLNLVGSFKRIGPSFENVKRYAVVPKQKPEVAKAVEKAFAVFRKTPKYRQIIEKYVH